SGTTNGSGVKALLWDGAGKLYAGGHFLGVGGVTTSGIAKWDGNAWSGLGPGLGQSASSVNAVALDGSGILYAGGTFNTGYFSPGDYIAKWNGNAWSAVESTI